MNINRVLYISDIIEPRLAISYLYACKKMIKVIDAKICMHFFEMHSTGIPKRKVRVSDKAPRSPLKRRKV